MQNGFAIPKCTDRSELAGENFVMKVEFLIGTGINDGRQILIQESEFKKAKTSPEEYDSFAFATNCLFAFYGASDDFIRPEEYEKILSNLDKGGSVIIAMAEESSPRRRSPVVFVSNNGRLKLIEF